MQDLIDRNENANTKKNTKWAARVFETWRDEIMERDRKFIPELNAMTSEEMNFYLIKFIVECRKRDSTEYPPKSLYLMTCGLLRSLRDNGVHDKNFLDTSDFRFAQFRKVLDSRMKDLLKRGFGTQVKQADPIFPEDELKIWEKGVFGDINGETLQCTMFFYNCKLFGMRGHDEHHDLQCSQFVVGEDSRGKYVQFFGRSTKTFKGGLAQRELENKNIRHYSQATDGDRCIVDYYDKYLDALGREGKFYRRPLAGKPARYGNQPVGVNKLKNMMKVICSRAGLQGNYSNHSGKRTLATQLYVAGVDEQEIMKRTGHRSEKAVRRYKRANDEVGKRVSTILDPPCKLSREEEDMQENDVEIPKKRRNEDSAGPLGDLSNRPFFSVSINF